MNRPPPIPSSTGWLRTGDLGSMDGDGFLTLTDRVGSMWIILDGRDQYYPREVEETSGP